jgi:hypothetical protein
MIAVTTVPHSSTAFAIDSAGTDGNADYRIAERSANHWRLLKPPKLNGRYGTLYALAAGSKSTIWLGGARQVGGNTTAGIQGIPTIWRWKSGAFHPMKIGALYHGADAVSSISASGPDNAWAVGAIYDSVTADPVSLHWNGKKWSQVPVPTGEALLSVTTSGAHDAWAVDAGSNLLRWNGTAWTLVMAGVNVGTVVEGPGKTLYGIDRATPSASLQKFNGTAWSAVSFGKKTKVRGVYALSIHGRSIWVMGVHGTRTVVVHSDGGKWSTQFEPKSKFRPSAISAHSASSATLVGEIYHVSENTASPYAAATNGHGWHSQAIHK